MPFEPEDIAGVVEVWVADDIAQADGSAVASWVGRVAASDLAQATGSKQPLYRATGGPTVDFDGTDDLLRLAGTLTAGTSGHVFAVALLDGHAASCAVWASSDEASALRYILGQINTTPKQRINQSNNDTADDLVGSTTLADSTAYLLEWASSGTPYALRVNAALETLTPTTGSDTGDWFAATTSRDNFTVGALKRSDGELAFFNGKIAALIVVDSAISTGDRQALYDWVDAKYEITLPAAPSVFIPLGSTWRYLQIGIADLTNYSAPGFDDSSWATGPGTFGEVRSGGVITHPYPTVWNLETRLWTRYHLTLSHAVADLTISGRIDNSIVVYWNGTIIGVLTQVSGGPFSFPVPLGVQTVGVNVIAVRSTDDAAVADPDGSYFDATVTGTRGGWSIGRVRW